MRTYEQRLDEAREELARASDGETVARLAARIEVLEARLLGRISPNPHMASIGQGVKFKFDPIKHPRARAGKFRATGHYAGPNPHMASIGQERPRLPGPVRATGSLPPDRSDPSLSYGLYQRELARLKKSDGRDAEPDADSDDAPALVKRIRKITGYDRNTAALKRFGHALVDDKNSMFPAGQGRRTEAGSLPKGATFQWNDATYRVKGHDEGGRVDVTKPATGTSHKFNPTMEVEHHPDVAGGMRANAAALRAGAAKQEKLLGDRVSGSAAGVASARAGAAHLEKLASGIEAKGQGRKLDVFDRNQLKVARSTLKMHPGMAGVMGGPSPKEAVGIIRDITGKSPRKADMHPAHHHLLDTPEQGRARSLNQVFRANTGRGQERKEIPGPRGVGMNVSDEQFSRGLDAFLSPAAKAARRKK